MEFLEFNDDIYLKEIKDIIRAVQNDFPVQKQANAELRAIKICPQFSSYKTAKGNTIICYAHSYSFFTSKDKPIADKYMFTGIWFMHLEEEKSMLIELADFLRWKEKGLLTKIYRHGSET